MHHYPYLIIGDGIAADAAVRGIRQLDSERSIAIIGAEPHTPYDRPPLSKELWRGGSASDIDGGTAELGVDLPTTCRTSAPTSSISHTRRWPSWTLAA